MSDIPFKNKNGTLTKRPIENTSSFSLTEKTKKGEHMTHTQIIQTEQLKAHASLYWYTRHIAAWLDPSPKERPIVEIVQSLALYADTHADTYGSGVGKDSMFGVEWANMMLACIALLNGDCGRLDCGTVNNTLCAMLKKEGFDNETPPL